MSEISFSPRSPVPQLAQVLVLSTRAGAAYRIVRYHIHRILERCGCRQHGKGAGRGFLTHPAGRVFWPPLAAAPATHRKHSLNHTQPGWGMITLSGRSSGLYPALWHHPTALAVHYRHVTVQSPKFHSPRTPGYSEFTVNHLGG